MRKTLLTLVAVLLGFSTYAADIVENWEEKSSFGPTTNGGASAVSGTSPLTGIEYSFMKACKAVPGQAALSAYLSFASRSGAYVEFTLPINCKEIKLKTTINTTSTGKINILADGNTIQSAYAVGEGDKEYSVEIPEEYRKTGTVYRIARTTGTLQFASFTYVEAAAGPDQPGPDQPDPDQPDDPNALSVPYSITFDEPEKIEGWASVGPNERPKFMYFKKQQSPVYSGFNCVASKNLFSSNDIEYKDAWFISPAVNLKAGKKYTVKYTVGVTNGESAKLGVFFGKEATAEAMTNTALALESYVGKGLGAINGAQELFTITATVAPTESGTFHIGFYDNTDKYCSAKTILTDFSIAQAAAGEMPGNPTDFTATPASTGALSVTLSAKAPAVDAEGNALKELTALEFLRDGTVIETVKNPTPGATYTYTDNEAKNGNNTYAVRALNSFGSSNLVEEQVKAGLEIPKPMTDVAAHQTEAGKVKVTWTKPEGDIFGFRFPDLSLITAKVEVYDGTTLIKTFSDLAGDDAVIEINDGTADQKFYNLKVYAVTSGGPSLETEVNAVPVGKAVSLPYSENFSGATASQLIQAVNNERYSASWTIKDGFAQFMSTSGSGATASLYSGLIALPADAKVKMTFNYSNYSGSNTNPTLSVLINSNGEWVEAKSYEVSSSEDTAAEIDLSDYAGKDIQYALRGKLGMYGYYIKVADIKIAEESESGIESIITDEAAEGEAIFYDLMGRRVNNPAAGKIYIKVLNGKAFRVLVK
ncbi:MAG: hypothetical protein K2H17_10955 [Duncaniella sp.]|uniref:hypothetical protein n=1 Tax=Duncaniella sp. TaxID=2518496 RepID=UPI0023CF0078|nr:hypothetical protein [Duncaniella sp.]MDE5989900.1 hypothetical protein [Duncaniella sp.]